MTDTGGIIVERDLMVPARDGVPLATDVYRPDGPGPFPVLLERTPYDKSAPSRSERPAAVARPQSRAEVPAYFVGHGYAVAYQDCRGRYHSGGHFTKYLSEAEATRSLGSSANPGATAASAPSGCPMLPTPRRHSAASTRRDWPHSSSIAAASPMPTAVASATAARSI